ncbi:MAG TPA: hypothetical protein VD865_13115 [Stenotrophomonas sp.]|nr:hypothetical protein [Stenotrophomonas sp.]
MDAKRDQLKLPIKLKPTAEDYRVAAARALQNPWETPEACQRRHDFYLSEAQRLEREVRRAA